ncbi:hypothetical protein Aab01nite_49390 [Paractinoplanes abujensis]|uniref:Uncharacterized protein n=1 Tax=Paractinoplanes abujensis TaxID=882441 RepID=A0A7W7CSR3_9ACTN|nr:hypothetical protein [Actinoplanes abujensis]MBB4693992.1 hypothetical protein [Actinoplanes abujensis]GID21349.1 hypothetical protein Aab01nite_49390 [Actinoplanes abujensis]
MSAELVRHDGQELSFTGTVFEFAVALRPLLALSGLVAKVVASRVEVQRLQVAGARADPVRAARRRPGRRPAPPAAGLGGLEQRFDAALRAIKLEGAHRRAEADRRFAAEMARIDGAFQAELARQAAQQRQNRQSFAAAREHLRRREADRRDLGNAMTEATRLMTGRSGLAEMAALTVPVLSRAMTSVATGQDGAAAVLEALSLRALPSGGKA